MYDERMQSQQSPVPIASYDAIEGRLVCPSCRAPLPAIRIDDTRVECISCGSTYTRGRYWFDFTPPDTRRDGSPLWNAWRQLQANGLASYTAAPERNLSVGDRDDCRQFAAFCSCRGLVLDVGCGPQAWPAYFESRAGATYVGIDPLADLGPAAFLKITGLAEYLPFAGGSFDHVLFSTTIDHFVDPSGALREARRVAGDHGEVDVWLGEKDAGAPAPAVSPDWYTKLRQPDLAEDVFHIERLTAERFRELARGAGLRIADETCETIDTYRRHWFFRLRAAGS